MKSKVQVEKLINEALGSVEGIERAEVKPFLLTRIHARMNRGTESLWEKAGMFITRPAIAFSGMCLIVMLNLAVIAYNRQDTESSLKEQTALAQSDEFSYTVATIYDIENVQVNDK